MRLFTGGGDWRKLALGAKSVACMVGSAPSVGVGGATSDFVIEGDRLCLCMYEADLGGVGRPMAGDRGPSSQYDDDRLSAGLLVLDVAGDCCDGGVYGISYAQYRPDAQS